MAYSFLAARKRGVHQEQTLFSMFINFLNNEIKVNLNKFADNIKLKEWLTY